MRGHLAAVDGTGDRAEDVEERVRFLAAVGLCEHDGCGAPLVELLTIYGPVRVMFDAVPVPMTAELVERGDAYVPVRCSGSVVWVNAKAMPADVRSQTDTCLTPHRHG
jgi:hypothetical protein